MGDEACTLGVLYFQMGVMLRVDGSGEPKQHRG